jgi:hypothetical protein
MTVAPKILLMLLKCLPDGAEDRTLRIEPKQAFVVLTGNHAATSTRNAPHFPKHGFRPGHVLENVPGVNKIETSVGELEPVGVTLDVLDGGICGCVSDLFHRLFHADNLYIRCGPGHRATQKPNAAADFQNTHPRLNS